MSTKGSGIVRQLEGMLLVQGESQQPKSRRLFRAVELADQILENHPTIGESSRTRVLEVKTQATELLTQRGRRL